MTYSSTSGGKGDEGYYEEEMYIHPDVTDNNNLFICSVFILKGFMFSLWKSECR